MNNIKLYHILPVLTNFFFSVVLYGKITTDRYAIFSFFFYLLLLLIHSIYFLVGSSLYEVDYLKKEQILKYWMIFNLPMFVLVAIIDIVLYIYGDIEGKINNHDVNFFIYNNTMMVLWVLSSILFRYKSNYFR